MALTGCELLVVGNSRDKLSLLSARGIKTGFADSANPVGFDIAVECTGNPEGFAIGRSALRPRGADRSLQRYGFLPSVESMWSR